MSALDESHFVEFLEAAYALERDDDDWLTSSLAEFSKFSGADYNYFGFFYDASDVAALKVTNLCRLQAPLPELSGTWSLLQTIATPDFVRAVFRSLPFGSAREGASHHLRPLLEERERNGHGDLFFLNSLDPSGTGCIFGVGSQGREFRPGRSDVLLLRRIVMHLSAAHRCRRRLASVKLTTPAPTGSRLTHGAEAILDSSGRVVHAEGAAESAAARAQIRDAAKAIDAARSDLRRRRGSAALDGWHPLTSARWTLIDSFEEAGRRYVVARENQAGLPGVELLTDRERQVVVHAAMGLSNKEIAYTLGISDATVRVLMSRATKRLGVRTRKELLALQAVRDVAAS